MTADKLQHLLQSRSEGEGHSAQLVVVHVGVHDVLKGVQHGDIAQNIRQAVTPYAKRLVICSVPEVNTRGKATQARAMLLNAELRKMSGAVKAKFVDLSRMLAGEGRLAQDGIHYLAHTTREVATQLVQETRNFLGLREPHRNRGKPTRRPPPNIGSRVPMPALEIHSPSPETTQDHKRDHPPGGNQGRCTDHPRANPPRTHPAGLRSKHGTASTFEHTPSTGDEFGSANMGATSGHCTPYEDPVASIQAQRKPRAVSNGWGNGPPANDAPNNNAESNHPMILKSRRRHHHRKRTTTNVNVGFLNLHGARKAAKWAELYKTLNSEKIALYGVVETHLRELEEPPVDPEWQWVGCNRTGDCRKGGGAGVLWRSNTAWMPMKGPCAEHIGFLGLFLVSQFSLEIVNLRTDCEGCFTWCARTSRSTIDYALVTAKLAARIAQVHIDEEGQFSLGSDHNRIRLLFSKGGFRTGCMSPPPRRGMYLPSKSVERVAKDFESSPQRRESRSYKASPIETAAKWTVEVRMRVREAEETRWREAMEAKSTLECYRKHQDSICGSRLYDNSIGSSLLFEARAGALRTLEYRRKFDATVVSNLCRVCGVASETQEHLVLHCRSLPTSQVEGATLPQALGFQRLDEDGSSDNGGGRYAVAATKRRLTEWWATIRRT
ncbi:hypothetical protein HPB51_011286 [Rhipicephalus microplus]|uniref:Tick transposon n=1 Tax=Rhipicephalus microplus TaxID=6941 RepID=A0A9J6DLX4_RHIMP|nr:hypothetical protein HPB51_011286 [Rhipicephalus microplus]